MTQLLSPRIFRKGGKNYRRWTAAHKRQIVEETFVLGSSVSIVARRHDVNANQVFKWRLLYHRGELGSIPVKAVDGFLPVGVIGHNGVLTAETAIAEKQETPKPVAIITSSAGETALPVQAARPEPVITLSLRKGVQVRMEGDVGLAALRCVLRTALSQS